MYSTNLNVPFKLYIQSSSEVQSLHVCCWSLPECRMFSGTSLGSSKHRPLSFKVLQTAPRDFVFSSIFPIVWFLTAPEPLCSLLKRNTGDKKNPNNRRPAALNVILVGSSLKKKMWNWRQLKYKQFQTQRFYLSRPFSQCHTWVVSRPPEVLTCSLHRPRTGPGSSPQRCGRARWSSPPLGLKWGWRGATPAGRWRDIGWRRIAPPPCESLFSSSAAPEFWRDASPPADDLC